MWDLIVRHLSKLERHILGFIERIKVLIIWDLIARDMNKLGKSYLGLMERIKFLIS